MSIVLNVFISSKMVELKPERDALFKLIPTLDYGDIELHGWVFEEDAEASSEAIRSIYLDALKNSALYIGIFWQEFGEWTIDEFDRATEWGMERHIFVKDVEADKRDPNLTEFLNKQGDVKKGITAKWFKGKNKKTQIANLCIAVKKSLDTWVEKYRSGPRGESSARIYIAANAIIERPKKLIGREDILETVKALLNKREQVLLHGFSGVGKTALAAEIAAQFTPLIWLRAGHNNETELFEALARPFSAQEAIAKETGVGKVHLMRSILAQSNLKLVVLDDAWNGQALQVVIQAVPSNIALLVTSRRRYGLDRIITVSNLDLNQSLELLGYYAKQDYLHYVDAVELCKKLGYLAFALRIAGLSLKMNQWSPHQLIARLDNPSEDLIVPLDFVESGRETVAKLIQVSLNALDDAAGTVFLGFGAFFAPQMTAEMLMYYFGGTVGLDEEGLTMVRLDNPQLPLDMSNNQLQQLLSYSIPRHIDSTPTQKALETLHLHGLVEQHSNTDTSVISYRIHDLAYSFVKNLNGDEQHMGALEACLSYLAKYKESSLASFASLLPELDNFVAATNWAFEVGEWMMVDLIVRGLYIDSHFLTYQGFYVEAIHLLQLAVEVAKLTGNKIYQGIYLGNLANTYTDLGKIKTAIDYYKQALIISREIGHRESECSRLTNLANAYTRLGKIKTAIDYLKQALMTSREIGNKEFEGGILANLGIAYFTLKKINTTMSYYKQALMISHEIGNKVMEGSVLGNLGIVYENLGQIETAIYYHEQSLNISRQIGNKNEEMSALMGLGEGYAKLYQIEKAFSYYEQSLVISREIGDHLGEANTLYNLGVAYEQNLLNYSQALHYYRQALVLYIDIGVQYMVLITKRNITRMLENIGNLAS